MKKFIMPMAAMLLIASAAGAQTTQKHSGHSTMVKKETMAKKPVPVDKSTASVTTSGTGRADSKTAVVARKHHHKKVKHTPKTQGK